MLKWGSLRSASRAKKGGQRKAEGIAGLVPHLRLLRQGCVSGRLWWEPLHREYFKANSGKCHLRSNSVSGDGYGLMWLLHLWLVGGKVTIQRRQGHPHATGSQRKSTSWHEPTWSWPTAKTPTEITRRRTAAPQSVHPASSQSPSTPCHCITLRLAFLLTSSLSLFWPIRTVEKKNPLVYLVSKAEWWWLVGFCIHHWESWQVLTPP